MGCCASKASNDDDDRIAMDIDRGDQTEKKLKSILKQKSALKDNERMNRESTINFGTRTAKSLSWRNPINDRDVLSFWFGEEYYNSGGKKEKMLPREYGTKRSSDLWYSGKFEADALCSAYEREVIVAQREDFHAKDLKQKHLYNLDKIFARIILLDQIARNVFRGTWKAFIGDETALRYARFLVEEREEEVSDLPPSAIGFVISPFLHSEDIKDHVFIEKFARKMILKHGPNTSLEWSLKFVVDHKEVLEKFGRYPHRNELMGRMTTKEERDWLNSATVPGWARSQQK